jgi:hypothetical protein
MELILFIRRGLLQYYIYLSPLPLHHSLLVVSNEDLIMVMVRKAQRNIFWEEKIIYRNYLKILSNFYS